MFLRSHGRSESRRQPKPPENGQAPVTFGQDFGDCPTEPSRGAMFLESKNCPSLLRRRKHRFYIEGFYRVHAQYAGLQAHGAEKLGHLNSRLEHPSCRNKRDVIPLQHANCSSKLEAKFLPVDMRL